jgi:DNA-directed RNA polymerases I, II, and III subunit RPABC2
MEFKGGTVDPTHECNSKEFSEVYETKKESYKTVYRLTKYEMTKVLAERANQISNGSPIMVDTQNTTNAYEIAVKELAAKKIPFIIKRPYGNTYEYWKLGDLV